MTTGGIFAQRGSLPGGSARSRCGRFTGTNPISGPVTTDSEEQQP